MIYSDKYYRVEESTCRWISTEIKFETSDLLIKAKNIDKAAIKDYLISLREEIRNEEQNNKDFLTSLNPLPLNKDATKIVVSMYKASAIADTGPMAAVAGAIGEFCGKKILETNEEVIIENGGDIWCSLKEDAIIGAYPGGLYFKEPISLKIKADDTPCGICTSSGVIGKSLSFGKADAVTIIADNGAQADAVATASCNLIKEKDDIETALTFAMKCNGVRGILIIYKELLAAKGNIELAAD